MRRDRSRCAGWGGGDARGVLVVAALVACVIPGVAGAGDATSTPAPHDASPVIVHEGWHDEWDPAQVGVIATLSLCAGVLVVAACLAAATRRVVPLTLVLLAMIAPTIWVTGMTSWILAHQRMRASIQRETEDFALTAAGQAALSIRRAVNFGPLFNHIWANMYATGVHTVNDSYPTPFQRLNGLRRAFQNHGAPLEIVYFSNEEGHSFGVGRSMPDGSHTMYYVFPYGALNESFVCYGTDAPGAVCGDRGTAGTLPPACETAAGARRCAGTCRVASTPACYGVEGARGGTRAGLFTAASWNAVTPAGPAVLNFDMDAREQPPYTIDRPGLTWTKPYVFSDAVGAPGADARIGFTASLTVNDPVQAARGAAVPVGVVSSDFTTTGLMAVLQALSPTNGSHVILANYDGQVLSGTMPRSALVNIDPADPQNISVRTVWESEPFVREPFEVVTARTGSLLAAKDRVLLLHDRIDGAWSLVLSHPITAAGLELLLVITIPYGDVLQVSIDASIEGTVLMVVVSLLLCAGMGIVIRVSVAPLAALCDDMEQASALRAAEDPPPASHVQEVRVLQGAFKDIVVQITHARPFLPQHIVYELAQWDRLGQYEAGPLGGAAGSLNSPPASPCASYSGAPWGGGGGDSFPTTSPRSPRELDKGSPSHTLDAAAQQFRPAGSPTGSPLPLTELVLTSPGGGVGSDSDGHSQIAHHRKSIRLQRRQRRSFVTSMFSTWLETRKVAVLVLNLCNFHAATQRYDQRMFAMFIQRYWTKVLDEVAAARGIAEQMAGDRCLASFNASRPAQRRGQAAVLTAVRIRRDLKALRLRVDSLTAGVTLGRCTVGNLGCQGLRRFNLLGPVVTHAFVLEKLSRYYVSTSGPLASVLLTGEVMARAEDVVTVPLDLLPLPSASTVSLICAAVAEGRPPPASPGMVRPEDVFLYLRSKRRDEADAALAKVAACIQRCQDTNEDLVLLQRAMVRNMRARVAQRGLDVPRADVGCFYDVCVLGRAP